MTKFTPRLEAIFEKSKTVCFGRFLIDVPESTTVIWGETDLPLGVNVLPNGSDRVENMARKFVEELKSEKAIYHNDVPLLISVDNVVQPDGKIVIGYEDFEAVNGLKIRGYFKLEKDGILIDARPLRSEKDETTSLIKEMARRLRARRENDIPTEPGNCIDHGFLPDNLDQKKGFSEELVSIGFRLKEFPDTHLSIRINPSNPNHSDSNSLAWRLKRFEDSLAAENPDNPLLKTRYLRRGTRHIRDWIDGFEALSRTPEQPKLHSIHDFGMDFKGTPSDPLKPYADIRMQTGVAHNTIGATRASLTDDEAVAVWDKITSTIRVRPTNDAGAKTDAASRIALGEFAATGRTCPQTGWWEPSEPDGSVAGKRRHVEAGERMPHLMLPGAPSLWQKLKGEQPTYRSATVWKLVGYGDATADGNPDQSRKD